MSPEEACFNFSSPFLSVSFRSHTTPQLRNRVDQPCTGATRDQSLLARWSAWFSPPTCVTLHDGNGMGRLFQRLSGRPFAGLHVFVHDLTRGYLAAASVEESVCFFLCTSGREMRPGQQGRLLIMTTILTS